MIILMNALQMLIFKAFGLQIRKSLDNNNINFTTTTPNASTIRAVPARCREW